MATARRGFFSELKRRNVLRAAVLYAGAVWALSQGIAQLSPALDLPDYATRWFLIACVIGFPFWVAFAWFYEITPHGFKREREVAIDAPQRHSNARKLDFAIIGVLIVAVVLLASGYFVRRFAPSATLTTTASAARATPFNPPTDSIVVLPFANLDTDSKQQYFSDGITEELTDALGQNTALRVIAWDTASRYRHSGDTPAAIGKSLNVANLLHGSIEREGSKVRVIVELVNTRTGTQIWSAHYDDLLANVFQVQDRISAAIAGALKVKFASLGPAPKVNPQAYDLVLQARALMEKSHSAAPFEQARTLFEQAIALDPAYADAHAGLAGAWFVVTQYSSLPLKDVLPKVREEANRALALDPRNVAALVALGNADSSDNHMAKAKTEYQRALAIDPSNAAAHVDYSNLLPLQQSLAQTLEAVQLDPDNAAAQNNLAANYLDVGEFAQALAPLQAQMRLDLHSADSAFVLALTYALLHRNEDAVKAFDLAQPDTPLAKELIATGRLTYQSMLDPKLHAQALTAVDALRQRADLDPMSMPDVIQLYLALGQNATALGLLPKFCTALLVACSDISVNPLYLPLHGQPRFEALVQQYDTVSKPAPTVAATASAPASTASK